MDMRHRNNKKRPMIRITVEQLRLSEKDFIQEIKAFTTMLDSAFPKNIDLNVKIRFGVSNLYYIRKYGRVNIGFDIVKEWESD